MNILKKTKDKSMKILTGIPVSQGRVNQKPAVIINSSEEFDKMEGKKNVILVVKNFDPNYDQLLPQCAGVVSELGNILCHLAIVSRIYNKPAIVNAKDATKKVRDGQIVSLDAFEGALYNGKYKVSEKQINAELKDLDQFLKDSDQNEAHN